MVVPDVLEFLYFPFNIASTSRVPCALVRHVWIVNGNGVNENEDDTVFQNRKQRGREGMIYLFNGNEILIPQTSN